MRIRLDRIARTDLVVIVPACRRQTHPIHNVTRLDDGRVRITFGNRDVQMLTAPADHLVTIQQPETTA